MGPVTSFKTKTLIQQKRKYTWPTQGFSPPRREWAEKSPGNEVAVKAGSVYIAMLQNFEKEVN